MKVTGRIIALTFIGGFIGTLARYLLSGNNIEFLRDYWLVNILGAIAIAIFLGVDWFATDERRAFYVTGIAGGFTTMSALSALFSINWAAVVIQLICGVVAYLITRLIIAKVKRV